MILKEWTPDFNFNRDMIHNIPILVKLLILPLYLWGSKSLRKLGSVLGNPLFTDECTAHKLRVSSAHILVEIDVTQNQKESIIIKNNEGKKIVQ